MSQPLKVEKKPLILAKTKLLPFLFFFESRVLIEIKRLAFLPTQKKSKNLLKTKTYVSDTEA